MNNEQYIVTWCHLSPNGGHKDFWEIQDDLQTAKHFYNHVLKNQAPCIASISAILQSTDYDIHPRLNDLYDAE